MYQVIKRQVLAGNKAGKRGFTLIELLVVVLIIGILAAVALPQYNKAVWKAKMTEFYTLRDALKKNFSAYYLQHGTLEGITSEDMDITLPELTYWKFCPNDNCDNASNTFAFNTSWHSTGGKPYTGLTMTTADICIKNNDIRSDNSTNWRVWSCYKKDSSISGKNKEVCGKYFTCIPGDPNDVCHIEL